MEGPRGGIIRIKGNSAEDERGSCVWNQILGSGGSPNSYKYF